MSQRLADFNSMALNDYGYLESVDESKTINLLNCIFKIQASAQFLVDEFDNDTASEIVTACEKLSKKITYNNGDPISFTVKEAVELNLKQIINDLESLIENINS